MSAGVQKRRHLWKSGWDLGFDYPGKASYLCRAKGIVLFVPRVLYLRFRWGYGWRLSLLIWSTWYWRDWDCYAPREVAPEDLRVREFRRK